MNSYFSEAGSFLVSVIFGFFILMIMLRFLLQTVRADFYNPISQFIVKITDPLLKPLRRIIPGLGGIDMAAIVLLIILQYIESLITFSLQGTPIPWLVLFILTLFSLLKLLLYIYIFGIIIVAIASWIAPAGYNPVLGLIQQIIAPIMRPIQKWVKPVSGMDLSPLVALLILNLLVMAIPYLQRSLLMMMV
jgi:YggT family protein